MTKCHHECKKYIEETPPIFTYRESAYQNYKNNEEYTPGNRF
jgi:hypothetical protein